MDKRPLKDVPEKELKGEIQRRKDEEKQAYKEWLLRTRPKRARFVRHFTFSRDPPLFMLLVPVVVTSIIGSIFPAIAPTANYVGMGIVFFLTFLCFVGSFIEAFCEGAYQKMHSDEQDTKP
jgi:hypothetical protein